MNGNQKVQEILRLYTDLLKSKVRALNEETYIGIIEVCLRNGNLNHASYFLCQMDRLKFNIPRKILDMFLDYSISQRFFEKKEEAAVLPEEKPFIRKGVTNKFDDFTPTEPEFQYFFSKRNQYKNRIDEIQKEYKRLKVDAKPYVPKRISGGQPTQNESEAADKPKLNLNTNAKDFIPKNYRIIKKVEESESTIN